MSTKPVLEKDIQDMLREVKENIATALKQHQKVIVFAEPEKAKGHPHVWDIFQVLLTAALGFGVWYTQSSLSDRINSASQATAASYVLTQEYHKARIEAYRRSYEQLAQLERAFENAEAEKSKSKKEEAIQASRNFYDEVKKSELYFSPDAKKNLNEVSFQGNQMPVVNPGGKGQLKDWLRLVEEARQQMYSEVNGEIGDLRPKK